METSEIHRLAVKNLEMSVRRDVQLPNRCFSSRFNWIYTSEYSTLFKPNSASLFKLLLATEGSQTAALSRPDYKDRTAHSWSYDLYFISTVTDDNEYRNFVNGNQPIALITKKIEQPWAVMASEFGATSELATWCIYGEYNHEIFLLGFEERPAKSVEERLAVEFFVRPLELALKHEYFYGEPGNKISAEMRRILRSSYLKE